MSDAPVLWTLDARGVPVSSATPTDLSRYETALQQFQTYVGDPTATIDAALAESVALSADFARPRWLVVAHVVNHGTQHRSELARYLTECGHSPGDLELLDALELRWPGDAV